MHKFVEFNGTDDKPVLVNLSNLIRVEESAKDVERSYLFFISGDNDDFIIVKHSYDAAMGKILNAS